jgi:hypothetical protein
MPCHKMKVIVQVYIMPNCQIGNNILVIEKLS